jgi:hypothetical protein
MTAHIQPEVFMRIRTSRKVSADQIMNPFETVYLLECRPDKVALSSSLCLPLGISSPDPDTVISKDLGRMIEVGVVETMHVLIKQAGEWRVAFVQLE